MTSGCIGIISTYIQNFAKFVPAKKQLAGLRKGSAYLISAFAVLNVVKPNPFLD